MAYVLVQEEVFNANAKNFISHDLVGDGSYITQSNIDPKLRKIEVTVIGTYLTPNQLEAISGRLSDAGLANTKLEVHQQADQQRIDVSTLKSDLLSDLYTKSQQALEKKEQQIQALQNSFNFQKGFASANEKNS